MKTPMKELLERVKEYRDSETDVIVRSRLNSVCVDIVGMLEKEKEVMSQVYADGGDGDEVAQPRFENYYNKTFKNKEK